MCTNNISIPGLLVMLVEPSPTQQRIVRQRLAELGIHHAGGVVTEGYRLRPGFQ